MQEAYIVKGYRSPVGKANRGSFKNMRPDDLAVKVIQYLMDDIPNLDPQQVDDVVVGNAVPEAEQGLQMARWIALKALNKEVPGMTVNRYCASGLETISIATAKIQSGMADCIIAGGAESMSLVPVTGYKTVPNYELARDYPDYFLNMGLTAEEVVKDYGISREEQDKFAYESHKRAIHAIDNGYFNNEIVPIEVKDVFEKDGKQQTETFTADTDEGPRRDTSLEALGSLKPVFRKGGSVTAGNSSQTSDGAAFTVVMSERMVKKLNLEPEAVLKGCSVAGVDPRIMGIGPAFAVPKVLDQLDMKMDDVDLIELNEAFASQSLVVMRELGMDHAKTNVNGGAISVGHPLGCTGAKLSIQIMNELKRRKQKYGMVTACVGGGQGIAGVIERL